MYSFWFNYSYLFKKQKLLRIIQYALFMYRRTVTQLTDIEYPDMIYRFEGYTSTILYKLIDGFTNTSKA